MADLPEKEILKRRAERKKRKKFRAGAKYPNGWPVKVGGRDCTVVASAIDSATGQVSYYVTDGKADRKVTSEEVTGNEPTAEDWQKSASSDA